MIEDSQSAADQPLSPPVKKKRQSLPMLKNIISMLASAILIRGSSFVLYLLIGRFLGTYEFGQTSLSLSLLNTVEVIAADWLVTYIIREVARNRDFDKPIFDEWWITRCHLVCAFAYYALYICQCYGV